MLSNTRSVRIEWGDCDPASIIFYPRYFGIFDASTTALFERALGMTKHKFLQAYDFLGYPLVDTRASFLKPTRFGDDVDVTSSIEFGTSSFTVQHRLTLAGELCAECIEKRVWAARDPTEPGRIRSRPVPDAVLAKFS
jgi:4-hydroxybenzoyl-CoA thioesterase